MMTLWIMFPKTNYEGSGQSLMILMNFCNGHWSILSRLSTWSILSFSRSSTIWAPSSQLSKIIFSLSYLFLFVFITWKLHRRQCHTLQRTFQSPSLRSCTWIMTKINQKIKRWKSMKVPLFQVLADLFIGDHSVCICQFKGILNVNDLASLANLEIKDTDEWWYILLLKCIVIIHIPLKKSHQSYCNLSVFFIKWSASYFSSCHYFDHYLQCG